MSGTSITWQLTLPFSLEFVSDMFSILGWKDICQIVKPSPKEEPVKTDSPKHNAQKGKKQPQKEKSADRRNSPKYLHVGAIVIVVFVTLLFVVSSLGSEYAVASSGALRMNSDWKESLEWMGTHTPDTGVDYYKIYNGNTFSYPAQAYGVMSWWDYGHMITYIAKRIPNANPFQAGVAGPNGAAAYFISTSENTSNDILKNDGTRYVITDIEMDTGKVLGNGNVEQHKFRCQPLSAALSGPKSG